MRLKTLKQIYMYIQIGYTYFYVINNIIYKNLTIPKNHDINLYEVIIKFYDEKK